MNEPRARQQGRRIGVPCPPAVSSLRRPRKLVPVVMVPGSGGSGDCDDNVPVPVRTPTTNDGDCMQVPHAQQFLTHSSSQPHPAQASRNRMPGTGGLARMEARYASVRVRRPSRPYVLRRSPRRRSVVGSFGSLAAPLTVDATCSRPLACTISVTRPTTPLVSRTLKPRG